MIGSHEIEQLEEWVSKRGGAQSLGNRHPVFNYDAIRFEINICNNMNVYNNNHNNVTVMKNMMIYLIT